MKKIILFTFLCLSAFVNAMIDYDDRLWEAVAYGDLPGIFNALAKDANIESKDKRGLTPLYIAVTEGNVDVIKLLMNYGANVNAINKKGLSILGQSIYVGQPDVINILLSNPKIVVTEKDVEMAKALIEEAKHAIEREKQMPTMPGNISLLTKKSSDRTKILNMLIDHISAHKNQ